MCGCNRGVKRSSKPSGMMRPKTSAKLVSSVSKKDVTRKVSVRKDYLLNKG